MTRRLAVMAVFATLSAVAAIGSPAAAQDRPPVSAVAAGRFAVPTPRGEAAIPVEMSADLNRPLFGVNRAVIVLHGVQRDAGPYFRLADHARDQAGALPATTLLLAPQFLIEADATTHGLPAAVLRWDWDGWPQGSPARGPQPVSSFDVLDALLVRLADAAAFPMLRDVVVAGHSTGAQLVQRYAAVGRGDAALTTRGVKLRYVVANPSSYLWFGPDRPRPAAPGTCPEAERWKYGPLDPPPYVRDTDPDTIERRYLSRSVVYLLGDADNDPQHRFLDRSCAAMTQGETRFARGMQFMYSLELRHPNLVHHRIYALPGVGHDAARVFATACGMTALFGRSGCVGL